jgi:hypothetical protein
MEILKEKIDHKKGKFQPQVQWWLDDCKTDRHAHVSAVVDRIAQIQKYRSQRNQLHARVYSNNFYSDLFGDIYGAKRMARLKDGRARLNVVKAVIDTMTSKIAKNRTRPIFLTTDGKQSDQQRAERLSKYVEGTFSDQKVYKKGQSAFRNACVFGTAALKVIANEARARMEVEQVIIEEITVDDFEGVYGTPRSLYQKRYMSRSVLQALFPEQTKELVNASGGERDRVTIDETSDMVLVIESWHLPSGPDAGDGMHVLCCDNVTLCEDPYDKEYFPFVFLRINDPILGFFAPGVVEEIIGVQMEVNKLLQDIQLAQHLVGVPQVWLERSSNIKQPIDNRIGAIRYYEGQPPKHVAPPSMSSDIYQHLWNLYQKAYEIVGISELSATLRKPAGLESKPALREYSDIETERFALISQNYQDMYLELSEMIIDMSRDLYEQLKGTDKELKAKYKGKNYIETIKWSEVDLEDDRFIMDAFPASLLPTQPAARLERVQELMEAGLINQSYALALLDFPDLESVTSLETASYEVTQKCIESILDKGKFIAPEPLMDLDLALHLGQASYLRAKLNGEKQERLNMLAQWLDAVMGLMGVGAAGNQTQAPAAPPPTPQPQNPQALPTAPGAPAGPPPGAPAQAPVG